MVGGQICGNSAALQISNDFPTECGFSPYSVFKELRLVSPSPFSLSAAVSLHLSSSPIFLTSLFTQSSHLSCSLSPFPVAWLFSFGSRHPHQTSSGSGLASYYSSCYSELYPNIFPKALILLLSSLFTPVFSPPSCVFPLKPTLKPRQMIPHGANNKLQFAFNKNCTP